MALFGRAKLEYLITATDKSHAALQSAERGIDKLRGAGARAAGAFGALTGAISGAALTGFVKQGIDSAEALYKVSQRLRVSTEELSTLRFAATQSNASFEALNRGLGFFQRVLGKSGQDINNIIPAFKQAADRIAGMDSASAQAAEAVRLFGRNAGPEMLEFMRQGSSGMDAYIRKARDLGLEISGGTAKAADEFKDKLEGITQQVDAAKVAFSGGFLDAVKGFKGEVTDRQFMQGLEDLGRAVGDFVVDIKELFKTLADNQGLLLTAGGALAGLVTGGLPGAAVGGAAGGLISISRKVKASNEAWARGSTDPLARGTIDGRSPGGANLDEIFSQVEARKERINFDQIGQKAGGGEKRAAREAEAAQKRAAREAESASKRADSEREALQDRINDLKSALSTELELENEHHKASLALLTEAQTSRHSIQLGGAQGIADLRLKIEQDHLSNVAAIEEEEEEEEQKKLDTINEERQARKDSLVDRLANLKGTIATELELESQRHEEALALVKEAQASEHAIILGGAKEIADLKLRIEQDHQERVQEIHENSAANKALKEQAEENSRIMQQPFLNAIDGIQGSFTDMFEDIFSGGVNSFGELADTVKKIFIRLAAEMASLFLFQNLFGGMGGIGSMLGMGGIAGAAGGMGGMGGAANLVGGASSASQLAGGPGLFSGLTTSINNFGTGLGFAQPSGFVGPPLASQWTSATLSSTLGAAGLSALGGGLISSAMGGNTTAGSLAGGALGAGGYALGATYGASFGPIGAAIGAILGGVLGGLIKKSTPRGDITREIGTGNVREFSKGGLDLSSLSSLADSIENATREAGKLLGITVEGARFGIGFDQKKGFNVNLADSSAEGGRRDVGFGLEDQAGVTRAIVLDVLNQQARTQFQQRSVGRAYSQSTLEDVLKSIAADLKFKKEFEDFRGAGRSSVREETKELKETTRSLAAEFHRLVNHARELGLNVRGVTASIRGRIRQQHVGRALDLVGVQAGLQEQTGFTGLREFRQSLQTSDVLAPRARLEAARREFAALRRRRDIGAARELPEAGQALISAARDVHGSGPQFAEVFRSVNQAINSLIESQRKQFNFADLDTTMRDLAKEQNNLIRRQIKENNDELRALRREIRRLGGQRAA